MKWARFSKFSAYARAESHLVQQTSYGAVGEHAAATLSDFCQEKKNMSYTRLLSTCILASAVTICGCLLALVLFSAELQQHLQPHIEQHVSQL